MGKCGKGYTEKKGRCVKKKKSSGTFNLGMEPSQRFGILLVIISFVVWYLRPFKECDWWNILCHGGSAATGTVFSIIMLILLLGGVAFLLKLDKLIFGDLF